MARAKPFCISVVGETTENCLEASKYYSESGRESRRQNLMRTVTPKVGTGEHPVEFLDSQNNRFLRHVWRRFEALGLQALEPKSEAVAFPVQDIHAVVRRVE